jgi:hypothetical protein
MKVIELPCHGIKIHLTGDGGGSVESDLHVATNEEGDEEFNAAMDGIESLLLALACTGQYDMTSPPFLEALETAVEQCANNL